MNENVNDRSFEIAAAQARLEEMLRKDDAPAPKAAQRDADAPERREVGGDAPLVSEQVPSDPMGYELHAAMQLGPEQNGALLNLANYAHAAGVPTGLFTEISRESEQAAKQALTPALRERLTETELRREFKNDYGRAQTGAARIVEQLEQRYPTLRDSLEQAGLSHSPTLLRWLFREGLKRS